MNKKEKIPKNNEYVAVKNENDGYTINKKSLVYKF
jgi:hypothetical protein